MALSNWNHLGPFLHVRGSDCTVSLKSFWILPTCKRSGCAADWNHLGIYQVRSVIALSDWNHHSSVPQVRRMNKLLDWNHLWPFLHAKKVNTQSDWHQVGSLSPPVSRTKQTLSLKNHWVHPPQMMRAYTVNLNLPSHKRCPVGCTTFLIWNLVNWLGFLLMVFQTAQLKYKLINFTFVMVDHALVKDNVGPSLMTAEAATGVDRYCTLLNISTTSYVHNNDVYIDMWHPVFIFMNPRPWPLWSPDLSPSVTCSSLPSVIPLFRSASAWFGHQT